MEIQRKRRPTTAADSINVERPLIAESASPVNPQNGPYSDERVDLGVEYHLAKVSFCAESARLLAGSLKSWDIEFPALSMRLPLGGPGFGYIETHGKTFDFTDPCGIPALIFTTNILVDGMPEDLAAIPLNDPTKLYLRLGVCRCIGEWELSTRLLTPTSWISKPEGAYTDTRSDEPLHFYETALDWLRGKCDGCMPVEEYAYADLAMLQASPTFASVEHMNAALRKGRVMRDWLLHPVLIRREVDNDGT